MNSTFYNGIAGVKTHQFGIDSWSNNIANISTHGYKAQTPEFSTIFATTMQGLNANSPISNDKGYGATRSANGIDMSVGSLELADESPLNMALSGQGWFVIGNKTGSQISYTRDGAFGVNGNTVENGKIIPNSGGFLVTNSGQYLYGVDLGRIDGSVFSTAEITSAAITASLNSVTGVKDLTPLQIPENLTYPPQATREVYTALNLNPTSSLRSISSVFTGNVPDTSTDMKVFAGFDSGDTITIGVGTPPVSTSLTYGTDFTSIEDFLSQIEMRTGLQGSYDNTGVVTFTNATGSSIDLTFLSSNTTALTTLGLPPTTTIADEGTLDLTATIPISTTPIFDELAFIANDMDTLFKEDGNSLNLKNGDVFNISIITTDPVTNVTTTTKESIVYGTDFTTVDDFIKSIEEITGLSAKIDETNNALQFQNKTKDAIELKFDSSNASLIQTLGFPSVATISSNSSFSSSSLKVPSYTASTQIYDASGAKRLLSSTFTLTSADPQTWQMKSGIYDTQGELLLSSQTVTGTLAFDANGNLIPTTPTTTFPVTLTLADGTSVSYDPTQDKTAADLLAAGQSVPTLHQTSGAKYMSSTIKQANQDGNAEGYLSGTDIDQNGIISLSFSNDKFETFGRVGVAGFINDQGLIHADNTLFKESANSGEPTLLWNWGQKSGELMGTSVLSGRLEMSNVDLATALTELMIYQRAYSASTKSITTADELIKEAIGLKR